MFVPSLSNSGVNEYKLWTWTGLNNWFIGVWTPPRSFQYGGQRVCVCVCVCVNYTHTHTHTYIRVCVCVCVCVCVTGQWRQWGLFQEWWLWLWAARTKDNQLLHTRSPPLSLKLARPLCVPPPPLLPPLLPPPPLSPPPLPLIRPPGPDDFLYLAAPFLCPCISFL